MADAQAAYVKIAPSGHTARRRPPRLPAARAGSGGLEGGWLDAPKAATPPTTPPPAGLTSTTSARSAQGTVPGRAVILTDTRDASTWTLAEQGKSNVVVLFFLGGKCAHCMQQLQLFGKEIEALKKLDTELVAVSTDDLETTRRLKENEEGVKFPMALLADPKLEVFRRYRAYDDFEEVPLHGTFLIDKAGNVRFQRIAAEPFLDIDFIKAESARVNRLVAPAK
ncbi:MAG: redoxin domain-containing protein [Isosphaeraceae bacterium]